MSREKLETVKTDGGKTVYRVPQAFSYGCREQYRRYRKARYFPNQGVIQRESIVCLISMDIVLFLSNTVQFDSCQGFEHSDSTQRGCMLVI